MVTKPIHTTLLKGFECSCIFIVFYHMLTYFDGARAASKKDGTNYALLSAETTLSFGQ